MRRTLAVTLLALLVAVWTAGPLGCTGESSGRGDADAPLDGDADDGAASGEDEALPPMADVWQAGPHVVGLRTVRVSYRPRPDKPDEVRSFDVEIFYPAAESARGLPVYSYDMKRELPADVTEGWPELPAIPSRAVRDAPVLGGRRPAMVFSHGSGGIRFQSVFFCQFLAGHGYVVLANDHPGNTLVDLLRGDMTQGAILGSFTKRPRDMHFVLRLAAGREAGLPQEIVEAIDPARMAVSGHSFGGLTTLLVQGEDDPAEGGPGLVRAAIPMAPPGGMAVDFTTAARFQYVPMLAMGGTDDRTLPAAVDLYPLWDLMVAPRYMLALRAAGHYTFSDICRLELTQLSQLDNFSDAREALEDGCAPTNIPLNRAQDIVNALSLAFLKVHVEGDARYAPLLAHAAVDALPEAMWWAADDSMTPPADADADAETDTQ